MTRNTAKHDALLDELLKDCTDPKDILGEHGLLRQLTKRVVERALAAELTAHLGYEPHARNGSSPAGRVADLHLWFHTGSPNS
jgi:putative transposase